MLLVFYHNLGGFDNFSNVIPEKTFSLSFDKIKQKGDVMTTFGIIGSSQTALLLCLEMQKMGIWVNCLTRHQNSRIYQVADSRYQARDIQSIINFAMDSDKVFIVDRELQVGILKELENLTQFVQNLDLYHYLSQTDTINLKLNSISDIITKGNKIQKDLHILFLADIRSQILAISQNNYQHQELKESLVSPPISHTLYQKLETKLAHLSNLLNLHEVISIRALIFEGEEVIFQQITQGVHQSFEPSYLAWQTNIYHLMIKQALDYPMDLHLKKEKNYYATWLDHTELSKLKKQIPYFPEFQLYAPYQATSGYLVLSEPYLSDKLQKLKKLMD